jgi:hypothetical protein
MTDDDAGKARDWWITTGVIREGADRLEGPYPSCEAATEALEALERDDLAVDHTPKGLYPPLRISI